MRLDHARLYFNLARLLNGGTSAGAGAGAGAAGAGVAGAGAGVGAGEGLRSCTSTSGSSGEALHPQVGISVRFSRL